METPMINTNENTRVINLGNGNKLSIIEITDNIFRLAIWNSGDYFSCQISSDNILEIVDGLSSIKHPERKWTTVEIVQTKDGPIENKLYWVDYCEGNGPQLEGGSIYENGVLVGHADPPGRKGDMGLPGSLS